MNLISDKWLKIACMILAAPFIILVAFIVFCFI